MNSKRAKHLIGTALLLIIAAVFIFSLNPVHGQGGPAETIAGFEVDANGDWLTSALYSGNSTAGALDGDDWVDGGVPGTEGVFVLNGANGISCYGSNVSINPNIDGVAAFICDGSADPKFKGSNAIIEYPENNRVTSGHKQNDIVWPVTASQVPGSMDFSHAYVLFRSGDSSCDGTGDNDDNFLVLSGARHDNEGDSFWGFEFNQEEPENFDYLVSNSAADYNLNFNRTVGDLLISFILEGGGTIPVLEVYQWDGTEFLLSVPTCDPGGEDESLLTTNELNDALAPPWNVVVCDPTDTNSSPSCRLSSSEYGTPGYSGLAEDSHLGPRGVSEAIIDLGAHGLEDMCFSSIIFTSRASQSIESMLKDVGGGRLEICDANIQIDPDDTNEVGVDHTFTVNVNKISAGASSPAAGVIVDVDLADANGAISTVSSDTCATGTDGSGQCTVTFTSDIAGTVTGHASADVIVNSEPLHRETDGTGSNSGDAVKTYVNAKISIAPDDTNEVGEPHTFTVTVMEDIGDGNGYVAASGEAVTVTLTDANGAAAVESANTCAATDGSGQCTVTFSSPTAGTVTGHAASDVQVGGLSLHRETDGSGDNGGDAVKTFVDGSIKWYKVDGTGALLGGAEFKVCQIAKYVSDPAPGQQVPIAPVCQTFWDNNPPDAALAEGVFELIGLELGTYNISEETPPTGYTGDPKIETVVLNFLNTDEEIPMARAWVNWPPNEGCTPGFWQGGVGAPLWNEASIFDTGTGDPDWTPALGNPFSHDTLFNDFFTPWTDAKSSLAGYTMWDLADWDGMPNKLKNQTPVKTARMLVAAYLNSAHSGVDFGYTTGELETLWTGAVNNPNLFRSVFNELGEANQRGCPLGSNSNL